MPTAYTIKATKNGRPLCMMKKQTGKKPIKTNMSRTINNIRAG